MQNHPELHPDTGILVHRYQIPVKGVKKKIIYHFSDVHLSEYDSLSTEHEKQAAIAKAAYWGEMRQDFANAHGEPCLPEQQQSGRTHLSNMLRIAAQGDAVVMAGDVCDYISDANLRAIDSELANCSVPYIAVCGNHDMAADIPDNCLYAQIKAPVQSLDLGDMLIVGIDNSTHGITAYQNRQLEKLLHSGKPLLIVMHIPLVNDENAPQLEACGDYFQLNHRGASEEVMTFVNLIKANASHVIAVLAGHLHFANNSAITPEIMQFVSSQGILGNLNRYEIGI